MMGPPVALGSVTVATGALASVSEPPQRLATRLQDQLGLTATEARNIDKNALAAAPGGG